MAVCEDPIDLSEVAEREEGRRRDDDQLAKEGGRTNDASNSKRNETKRDPFNSQVSRYELKGKVLQTLNIRWSIPELKERKPEQNSESNSLDREPDELTIVSVDAEMRSLEQDLRLKKPSRPTSVSERWREGFLEFGDSSGTRSRAREGEVSFGFEVGGVSLLGELGLRLGRDLPGGDESVDSISGLRKEESGEGRRQEVRRVSGWQLDGDARLLRVQDLGYRLRRHQ